MDIGDFDYQSVMSFGVVNIFGPILVTSFALAMRRLGWLIFGLMFVATGAAYPPLLRSHLK